jgi:hypothetical protein
MFSLQTTFLSRRFELGRPQTNRAYAPPLVSLAAVSWLWSIRMTTRSGKTCAGFGRVRCAGGLRAIRDAELAVDRGEVELDGVDTHPEARRDLAVREAECRELVVTELRCLRPRGAS